MVAHHSPPVETSAPLPIVAHTVIQRVASSRSGGLPQEAGAVLPVEAPLMCDLQLGAYLSRRGDKTSWSHMRPSPAIALSAAGSEVLYPYHTQAIRPGFWKLGKKIGAGSFGTVHQGLNEDTGMAIAVKVLKRGGGDDSEVCRIGGSRLHLPNPPVPT
jgi:hypothetical protein